MCQCIYVSTEHLAYHVDDGAGRNIIPQHETYLRAVACADWSLSARPRPRPGRYAICVAVGVSAACRLRVVDDTMRLEELEVRRVLVAWSFFLRAPPSLEITYKIVTDIILFQVSHRRIRRGSC